MRALLVLAIASACGGGGGGRATSTAPSTPTTTTTTATAPVFDYDASPPLDVREDGEVQRWSGIAIRPITFTSPRGGRVRALVVEPEAAGTGRAAVVLQHGKGVDKTWLLPDAELVARAGGIAIVVDAPDQRPAALRTLDYASHEHDDELIEHAAIDLRRAVDVALARGDVDPARIGFAGHSFGATQGAILAAVEPRIRALVLIAPGDVTRGIRTSQTEEMIALRATVPAPALDGYLRMMAPYDASRFLARARPDAAVLLQLGAYDAGVSDAGNADLIARSTARTEHHRYPTGHAITSISAMCDRLGFLARELGMSGYDAACAAPPASPP